MKKYLSTITDFLPYVLNPLILLKLQGYILHTWTQVMEYFYHDFFWKSMVFEGMRFQYIDVETFGQITRIGLKFQ